ncbi:MAG: transketolase [Synergistaceae bacterium]|jgi:transketolase|nr:transketolase [Synergistaceae bacterium]
MNEIRRDELGKTALEVRKDVVRMFGVAGAGGFSKALGIVDVLVYLYWEYMKVFPCERGRPERDRFVLGKGAAVPALYACLARRGFFRRDELWNYSRLGAMLQGYPDIRTPGIDAPWEPYGGAIALAFGISMSLRMEGVAARVFCLMDEDEIFYGEALESLVVYSSDGPGGVVLIVDSDSDGKRAAHCLEGLGRRVLFADGHDFFSMEAVFEGLNRGPQTPAAVITLTESENLKQASSAPEYGAPLSMDEVESVLSILK